MWTSKVHPGYSSSFQIFELNDSDLDCKTAGARGVDLLSDSPLPPSSRPPPPTTSSSSIHAEPPEIMLDAKLLAGLTAKAGSKIELPAEVTGKPEPRVKWTKADLVLKADERVCIDTALGHSTVTIAKTKRDDSSTYIIEATNSSGRATATVDVNILGERPSHLHPQHRLHALYIYVYIYI